MDRKDANDVLKQLKKSTQKDNQIPSLTIAVAGIPGEYFYKNYISRFELQEVTFNGLYIKMPQILAEGELLDIRFSLKIGGELLWSSVVIKKQLETITYVEFIELSYKTRKKIELFIDEVASKKVKAALGTK